MRGRKELLRWGAWFATANVVIMAVIGSRYLLYYQWPGGVLATAYTVLAYVGQLSLLAFVPYLVILAPLSLIFANRRASMIAGVVVAAAGIAALLLDTLVFAENRFHLNGLTISILGASTWTFAAIYLFVFLAFETVLARQVAARLDGLARMRLGPLVGAGLFSCLLGSHGIHAWADASYYVPVTGFTHYLPLYYPTTAKSFFERYGLIDLE